MKLKPMMATLVMTATTMVAPAHAVNGFTINIGNSDDDINLYRVAARFQWSKRWFEEGDWFLGGHYELGAAHMESDSAVFNTTGAAPNLQAVSFTPVFRLQRNAYGSSRVAPFVEAGIGLAYLTKDRIQNDSAPGADLGGHFQFENKLSAGVVFGKQQQYEASVNYFHYSNAGIEQPNDGIDSFSLSFSMWY